MLPWGKYYLAYVKDQFFLLYQQGFQWKFARYDTIELWLATKKTSQKCSEEFGAESKKYSILENHLVLKAWKIIMLTAFLILN